MKYITIMIAALLIGGCASIKNASEIRLSGSASGPMGLPSEGIHEIYSYGASVGVGNADVGYGHSLLFGNSVSASVYIPEIDAYLGNTYYYNNPYRPDSPPFRNWMYVKKTVKISLKKEERKKKRDERKRKRAERRAKRTGSS